MEKVAVEGASSLMIFRKSASAKLKKTYKDKLDTNSAVDFNDMNVHVAALLLKVYILLLFHPLMIQIGLFELIKYLIRFYLKFLKLSC